VEGKISSTEGTTQEDPLAMAICAFAVTLLICSLHHYQLNISQIWFADDTTAARQLTPLLNWWKYLLCQGLLYGYFPNSAKAHLIVLPFC